MIPRQSWFPRPLWYERWRSWGPFFFLVVVGQALGAAAQTTSDVNSVTPCPAAVRVLAEGQWAPVDNPSGVLRCPESGVCPGGQAGTCALGRAGVACSVCDRGPDWQPGAWGDVCRDCREFPLQGCDMFAFIVFLLTLLAIPWNLLHTRDAEDEDDDEDDGIVPPEAKVVESIMDSDAFALTDRGQAAISIQITLHSLQMAALSVDAARALAPRSMQILGKGLQSFLALSLFDARPLWPGCVIGLFLGPGDRPAGGFAVSFVLILFWMTGVGLLVLFASLRSHCRTGYCGAKKGLLLPLWFMGKDYRRQKRLRRLLRNLPDCLSEHLDAWWDITCNLWNTPLIAHRPTKKDVWAGARIFAYAFSVAFLKLPLRGLECLRHPQGTGRGDSRKTSALAPSLECTEAQVDLLPLVVPTLVLAVFSVISLAVYFCEARLDHLEDLRLMESNERNPHPTSPDRSVLLMQTRRKHWWWPLAVLLRNTCGAVAAAAANAAPIGALLWLCGTQMIYWGSLGRVWPWCTQHLNVLDYILSAVTLGLSLVCLVEAMSEVAGPVAAEQVIDAPLLLLAFVVLIGLLLALAFTLWWWKRGDVTTIVAEEAADRLGLAHDMMTIGLHLCAAEHKTYRQVVNNLPRENRKMIRRSIDLVRTKMFDGPTNQTAVSKERWRSLDFLSEEWLERFKASENEARTVKSPIEEEDVDRLSVCSQNLDGLESAMLSRRESQISSSLGSEKDNLADSRRTSVASAASLRDIMGYNADGSKKGPTARSVSFDFELSPPMSRRGSGGGVSPSDKVHGRSSNRSSFQAASVTSRRHSRASRSGSRRGTITLETGNIGDLHVDGEAGTPTTKFNRTLSDLSLTGEKHSDNWSASKEMEKRLREKEGQRRSSQEAEEEHHMLMDMDHPDIWKQELEAKKTFATNLEALPDDEEVNGGIDEGKLTAALESILSNSDEGKDDFSDEDFENDDAGTAGTPKVPETKKQRMSLEGWPETSPIALATRLSGEGAGLFSTELLNQLDANMSSLHDLPGAVEKEDQKEPAFNLSHLESTGSTSATAADDAERRQKYEERKARKKAARQAPGKQSYGNWLRDMHGDEDEAPLSVSASRNNSWRPAELELESSNLLLSPSLPEAGLPPSPVSPGLGDTMTSADLVDALQEVGKEEDGSDLTPEEKKRRYEERKARKKLEKGAASGKTTYGQFLRGNSSIIESSSLCGSPSGGKGKVSFESEASADLAQPAMSGLFGHTLVSGKRNSTDTNMSSGSPGYNQYGAPSEPSSPSSPQSPTVKHVHVKEWKRRMQKGAVQLHERYKQRDEAREWERTSYRTKSSPACIGTDSQDSGMFEAMATTLDTVERERNSRSKTIGSSEGLKRNCEIASELILGAGVTQDSSSSRSSSPQMPDVTEVNQSSKPRYSKQYSTTSFQSVSGTRLSDQELNGLRSSILEMLPQLSGHGDPDRHPDRPRPPPEECSSSQSPRRSQRAPRDTDSEAVEEREPINTVLPASGLSTVKEISRECSTAVSVMESRRTSALSSFDTKGLSLTQRGQDGQPGQSPRGQVRKQSRNMGDIFQPTDLPKTCEEEEIEGASSSHRLRQDDSNEDASSGAESTNGSPSPLAQSDKVRGSWLGVLSSGVKKVMKAMVLGGNRLSEASPPVRPEIRISTTLKAPRSSHSMDMDSTSINDLPEPSTSSKSMQMWLPRRISNSLGFGDYADPVTTPSWCSQRSQRSHRSNESGPVLDLAKSPSSSTTLGSASPTKKDTLSPEEAKLLHAEAPAGGAKKLSSSGVSLDGQEEEEESNSEAGEEDDEVWFDNTASNNVELGVNIGILPPTLLPPGIPQGADNANNAKRSPRPSNSASFIAPSSTATSRRASLASVAQSQLVASVSAGLSTMKTFTNRRASEINVGGNGSRRMSSVTPALSRGNSGKNMTPLPDIVEKSREDDPEAASRSRRTSMAVAAGDWLLPQDSMLRLVTSQAYGARSPTPSAPEQQGKVSFARSTRSADDEEEEGDTPESHKEKEKKRRHSVGGKSTSSQWSECTEAMLHTQLADIAKESHGGDISSLLKERIPDPQTSSPSMAVAKESTTQNAGMDTAMEKSLPGANGRSAFSSDEEVAFQHALEDTNDENLQERMRAWRERREKKKSKRQEKHMKMTAKADWNRTYGELARKEARKAGRMSQEEFLSDGTGTSGSSSSMSNYSDTSRTSSRHSAVLCERGNAVPAEKLSMRGGIASQDTCAAQAAHRQWS